MRLGDRFSGSPVRPYAIARVCAGLEMLHKDRSVAAQVFGVTSGWVPVPPIIRASSPALHTA